LPALPALPLLFASSPLTRLLLPPPQSNGVHFPWALQGGVFGGQEITFGDIAAAGGPADQWDALPTLAKLQIFGAIAFLEWCGENSKLLALSGEKHYMSGGTPGFYPSLKAGGFPHPVPLDLWDPFGFTKKMSPERKAKARALCHRSCPALQR
jgi:hypothetical protein